MGEFTVEKKERDALFDNTRAILIFLVIIGHLISERLPESLGIRSLYYYIYMFHMPAFVFITGYFSKNIEKGRETAVQTFLMPYLVFNTLFALMEYISNHSRKSFFDYYKMTVPRWGMWFLLACFIWRLLAKDLKKIRWILPASLIAGLGLPLFRDFGKSFTIGRVVALLFFFMAGLLFQREWIDRLKKIPFWAGGGILAASGVVIYFITKNNWLVKEILYLRIPYKDGEKMEQMLMRLVLYLLASIMTLGLLILVTRKKCLLSEIGQNTLTIYVFHLFLVRIFSKFQILKGQPYLYMALVLVLAVLLTWFLSRKFVRQFYDWIMMWVNHICFKKG